MNTLCCNVCSGYEFTAGGRKEEAECAAEGSAERSSGGRLNQGQGAPEAGTDHRYIVSPFLLTLNHTGCFGINILRHYSAHQTEKKVQTDML